MRQIFDQSDGETDYRVLIAYPLLAGSFALLLFSVLSHRYVLLPGAFPVAYGSLRFLRQIVVQVDGFRPVRAKMRAAANLDDLVPYLSKLPEGFVVEKIEDRSAVEHRTNAYFYRSYLADAQRSAWLIMGANLVTACVTFLASIWHPKPIDPFVLTLYQISLLLVVVSLASIYVAVRIDTARHLMKFDIGTSRMLLRNWYPVTDVSVWLLFASLVVLAGGLAIRLVFLAPDVIPILSELVTLLP